MESDSSVFPLNIKEEADCETPKTQPAVEPIKPYVVTPSPVDVKVHIDNAGLNHEQMAALIKLFGQEMREVVKEVNRKPVPSTFQKIIGWGVTFLNIPYQVLVFIPNNLFFLPCRKGFFGRFFFACLDAVNLGCCSPRGSPIIGFV